METRSNPAAAASFPSFSSVKRFGDRDSKGPKRTLISSGLDLHIGADDPRQQLTSKPTVPSPPTVPSHASDDIHELGKPADPPQISRPPSPSAAPKPAYANTHRRHLGASASSAAGKNQRTALRENSARGGDIGGLIVAVVIAHPAGGRLGVLVAALRHEVEDGVGAHELLHAASIS